MKVEDWDNAYGREVATWHYEPPWDFYDPASDPTDAAAMRDPARAGHRRVVLGDSGRLEAYWYFDLQGDVSKSGSGSDPT